MKQARFEVFPEDTHGYASISDEAARAFEPKVWRWRLVGANGEKMAQATESYPSRSNAIRATRDMCEAIAYGVDTVTVDS